MEEQEEFNSNSEEEEEEKEDPNELGKLLIKASAAGKLDEINDLIQRGANINFLDKKNWSSLMWACAKGQEQAVKILMESGARWDLFKSEDFIDEDEDGANDKAKGTNPLHWASFNGHTRVVWLLIKFGLQPLEVDVYGNNCIHHAAAGARHDILEVFLAFGVSVTHKNSRGHTPLHLATDLLIREMLQTAIKAKKCANKSCSQEFDIHNNRHLCQGCKRYFCANCKTFMWVYETAESQTPEKPICRCEQCLNRLQAFESESRLALDSNMFENVDNALNKINAEGAQIDVKLIRTLEIARERLKTEGEISEFIKSLSYVENYKTIQKSVYVLDCMLKSAQEKGVAVEPSILDFARRESDRLIAERNLRHQINITPIHNATEEAVSYLESLIQIAEQNGVAEEYTAQAKHLSQMMQNNINAHYILRLFLDYPVREYPEVEVVDPRKGGKKAPPQQEQKKAPRKKKREPKFIIPEWATELQSLIAQVDQIEKLMKQAQDIGLNQDFMEQAQENLVRMRKEIRFRHQQEEEARIAAEKKAAARKAAAKKR